MKTPPHSFRIASLAATVVALAGAGAAHAADRSAGLYVIPFAPGTDVKVTGDHLTHNPPNRIDMVGLNGGDRITAAAPGTIRFIQDGFSEKRPGGSPCNNNYVWIEHANGEWTKYSHMRKNSVGVDAGLDVGDTVQTRQVPRHPVRCRLRLGQAPALPGQRPRERREPDRQPGLHVG